MQQTPVRLVWNCPTIDRYAFLFPVTFCCNQWRAFRFHPLVIPKHSFSPPLVNPKHSLSPGVVAIPSPSSTLLRPSHHLPVILLWPHICNYHNDLYVLCCSTSRGSDCGFNYGSPSGEICNQREVTRGYGGVFPAPTLVKTGATCNRRGVTHI